MVTFIVTESLIHKNLKSTPWATYLFTEEWKYFENFLY
jgi:hypothetical protein